MTNSFSSSIEEARHEAFKNRVIRTIEDDVGRAYKLVQKLNLEVPRSGALILNRVYTIPPDWRSSENIHRSRIRSASWSVLHEANPESVKTSVWYRGIHSFRKFVARISKPFISKK